MSGATPIVLVPGFWLGAWAWDEVAADLRQRGHPVTAVTLPGLESLKTDRASISLSDHIEAICTAVRGAGSPAVLAVHSGAGVSGYGASDRVPELIAAMVYVDAAPAAGPLEPNQPGIDVALPTWQELENDGSSLEGLSNRQLEEFRSRAVPEPGAVFRESAVLTNDARLDVPSIVLCSRNVAYIDLPTGHWPMWSRPREVAEIISGAAKAR